jgi:glucose/arabinose dehydrogenase
MDAGLRVIWTSLAVAVMFAAPCLRAQNKNFHNAPASAAKMKDPYAGSSEAIAAGKSLYAKTCASCHGAGGQGTGSIPPLKKGAIQLAKPGEVFWFITHGDISAGMPAWESLPEQQRWQIVTYVKTLSSPTAKANATAPAAAATAGKLTAPPPQAPFTDFRFEEPGKVRKITPQDLPQPFATKSSGNGPQVVPRPEGAWPKVLSGFKVEQYAVGLENPRMIRTAPNGDFFVTEMDPGRVKVFRGIGGDGKPQQTEIFASGLKEPFGIAFYPPGPNPQWLYIGNTNEVVRFPYQNGDLKARGKPEHVADLPSAHGGHSTRDIRFSPNGEKMFVAVGSASNVDDPDTHPGEKDRADILEFNPDGSSKRIFAYGIRNAVGLAMNPTTGELWCSVNERDALGDNLVPDYITHVQDGGFYGWPWWYTGSHQDPRHAGKHPELKDKTIVADVLLQPHNASLGITFYDGKQFPAEYQGDLFGAEHGSWNKATRAGYEWIRVPLHQTGHATGEYEDFMTGFVLDNGDVWGRPVAVTVAPDGSLLVTDDGSNSIWHISYVGK